MASIGIGGVGQQLDLRNEQDDRRREAESVRLVQEIIGGINNYANLDRSERIMQVQESQEERNARKYEDAQIAALAQSALLDEQRAQKKRDADNVAAIVSAKKANAEAMGEAEQKVSDAAEANAEMAEKLELLRPVFGDDWVDAEIQKRAPSMKLEGAKITSPTVVQPPSDLELANENMLGADFPIETHIRGDEQVPLQAIPHRLTGDDLDPRNGAIARLAEMARKSGLNPDLVSEGLAKANIDSAMAAERAAAIARQEAKDKAEAAATRAKAEQEKWGYQNRLDAARAKTEGADQDLKAAQAKTEAAKAIEHLAKAGAADRRYRRTPGQTFSRATKEVLSRADRAVFPQSFVRAQSSLSRTLDSARRTFKGYTKSVEAARNAGSLLDGRAVEDAVRAEIASSYVAANEVMKSIEPAARYKLMGLNALQISEGDVAEHMNSVARRRLRASDGKTSPADILSGVVRETNTSLMDFGKQLEKAAKGGFKKLPKKPAFWVGDGTAHRAVELDRNRGVVRATDREVQERAVEGSGPRRKDLKSAAQRWSESWKTAYGLAGPSMRDGLDQLKDETRKKLSAFEAAKFPSEVDRNAALQQLHSELLAALPEFDQYIKNSTAPERMGPPAPAPAPAPSLGRGSLREAARATLDPPPAPRMAPQLSVDSLRSAAASDQPSAPRLTPQLDPELLREAARDEADSEWEVPAGERFELPEEAPEAEVLESKPWREKKKEKKQETWIKRGNPSWLRTWTHDPTPEELKRREEWNKYYEEEERRADRMMEEIKGMSTEEAWDHMEKSSLKGLSKSQRKRYRELQREMNEDFAEFVKYTRKMRRLINPHGDKEEPIELQLRGMAIGFEQQRDMGHRPDRWD